MFEVFKKDPEIEPTKLEPKQEIETKPSIVSPIPQTDQLTAVRPEQPEGISPEETDLSKTLQILGQEERMLLEEKKGLLAIERDLKGKLNEEIERRKMAISLLKTEIPGLKNSCDELASALGIPAYR